MKGLLSAFIIITCIAIGGVKAQVNSEETLVNRIIICLSKENDSLYSTLFPKYELLWQQSMKASDTNAYDAKRLANIRSNPKKLQQYDPQFNADIVRDFKTIHRKGIDSGLHWSDLVIVRYELEKMIIPKELAGLEKVVPVRLQGYIFLQDLLTRKVYTLTVKNIFGINGKWYGGSVVNVLEAENIEEYIEKLAAERKMEKQLMLDLMYGKTDTTTDNDSLKTVAAAEKKKLAASDEEDDEEKNKMRTDVLDRKLYTGTFDNNIPVELYVRYLKGNCPQTVCAWEAIYKFGDVDDYLKLDVTKSPDGKWLFTEEDVGVLELTLVGDKFTGTWTSFRDKTEYEAVLSEKKEVKSRKLFMLDDIIENGGYANP